MDYVCRFRNYVAFSTVSLFKRIKYDMCGQMQSNVTLLDGKFGYAAIIVVVLASVVIVGAGATAVLYYLYRTKTKRVADAPASAYQNKAYEDAEKKSIPSDVVKIVREGVNEKQ